MATKLSDDDLVTFKELLISNEIYMEAFAVQYGRSETFSQALLWLVWDFTSLRFVWEKIHPPPEQKPEGYKPPATIMVWVFGLFSLYIALFGLASQRYENAVDKIETRIMRSLLSLRSLHPRGGMKLLVRSLKFKE